MLTSFIFDWSGFFVCHNCRLWCDHDGAKSMACTYCVHQLGMKISTVSISLVHHVKQVPQDTQELILLDRELEFCIQGP